MVGPKFTIAILVCLGSVAYSVSAGKYYDDDNSSYESYEKPKSNSIFSSLRERVKKFFKLPEKLKGLGGGGGGGGGRRKNKYVYSYGPPPPPLPTYHNGPPHHNLPSSMPFSTSLSPYEASNSVGRFSAEFYDGGGGGGGDDTRRPILYPNHFHYQVQNEAYAPHHHHLHPDHYGYHGGSREQRKENKSADQNSETEETKEDVSSSSSAVKEEVSPKSSKGKKKKESPLGGKDPKRPSGTNSTAVGVKENESKEPQIRSKSKVSAGKLKISSSSSSSSSSKKKSSRKRKKSSKKSKPDDSDENKKSKKKEKRKAKKRSSESSEPEKDSLEPQNHYRRFQNLDGVRNFFKYGPRAFMRHRDSVEGAVRIARSTHYGRRDRDVEVITAAPLARQVSSREYLVGASMRATDKGVRRMKVKGIVMAADTAHTDDNDDDDARGRRNAREEEKDFNLMTMLKHMAKVK